MKFYKIDDKLPVKLSDGNWAMPFSGKTRNEVEKRIDTLGLQDVTVGTFYTAEMLGDIDHDALIFKEKKQAAFILLAFS